LAALPGYVSNYMPRAGTSFSAAFGGYSGNSLPSLVLVRFSPTCAESTPHNNRINGLAKKLALHF
jgi:hypothetical protein